MNGPIGSPEQSIGPVMEELRGLVTLHCRMKIQPTPIVRREQLARYDRPTLVLVAEHDCFWHAGETLVGAHRVLARPTVELLRAQGHVPIASHREANAARALSFLAEA